MHKKYQELFVLILLIFSAEKLIAKVQKIERNEVINQLSLLGIDHNKIPRCEFDRTNLCQNKNSGGHSGTIFSTKKGYCAKQIHSLYTLKEIDFYLFVNRYCKLNNYGVCDFFPEYAGLCEQKNQIYLQMENLKNLSKDKIIDEQQIAGVWALDLKIGDKTTSIHSMRRSGASRLQQLFWVSLHHFQDHYFTTSRKLGFRYAGLSAVNNQVSSNNFFSKITNYGQARKVIQRFLDGDKYPLIVQCFVEKLKKLNLFMQNEEMNRFHLVGSSILFVYDHDRYDKKVLNSCGLYMIDFANSFVIDDSDVQNLRKNLRYIEGYKKGLENLMIEFANYYRWLKN